MKDKYLNFAEKYASKYPAYARDDLIQIGLITAWKINSEPKRTMRNMRAMMAQYWKKTYAKMQNNKSLDEENENGHSLLTVLVDSHQDYDDDDSIKKVIRFLNYHIEAKTITENQGNCLLAFVWMYNRNTDASEILHKERTNMVKTVNKALEKLREFYKEVG